MRQRSWFGASLVLVEGLVALDVDLPVVRPVLALAVVLGLPTFVLFRRVGFLGDHVPARLLYAFGTSLLGLILVGLAVNTALPLVGLDHPLQPVVLAVTSLLVNLALLAWRHDSVPLLPPDWVVTGRIWLMARLELAQGLAVGSVVLAVLGAVRLNNGAGGAVALVALLLAAAALVALMVRTEASLGRDARCLGLVAVSLLLATSLRGWTITGHDIQSGYFAFVLTNDAQRWQMSSWHNAYNACLSLNILPTVLAQTTGLSGVVVFKLLLQLVFALVPVSTFLLARRFLPRRLALAAAIFTMAMPTFYTDMPYLVRQEIALFFFALLLLAATAPAGRRSRTLLVGLFGIGVILSHYSTTYMMLIGLVFGMAALAAWRLLRRTGWMRRRQHGAVGDRPPVVLLNPVLVLFLVLTSWVWAVPVTNTAGHVTDVAREAVAALVGKGEGGPASSDLSYSLFSRGHASPRHRLNLFVAETLKARKQAPQRVLLIKHPRKPELRPHITSAGNLPLTWSGQRLKSLGVNPGQVVSVARVAGAGLVQLLLLVGLLQLVRRRRRPDTQDPVRRVPEEAVCLCLGLLAALGVIVLIPVLSVDYGVFRAFQQTLLVVAPVVAVGMWRVVRPTGAAAAVLSVVLPVGLLLVFSGGLLSLLGGYPARLALSNSGTYYDRYYASDSDVQAVDWVVAADHGRNPAQIVANRNIAVRILSTNRDAIVADRLYPTLLTTRDYVFVNSRLQQTGSAAVFYTGDFITYRYPLRKLDQRMDLVYSSQLTRIYR